MPRRRWGFGGDVGDGLGGALRFSPWLLLQDGEYRVFVELLDLDHVDRWSELIGDVQIMLGERVNMANLVGAKFAQGILINGSHVGHPIGLGSHRVLR